MRASAVIVPAVVATIGQAAVPLYGPEWKALFQKQPLSFCNGTQLTLKNGSPGGKITCQRLSGKRHFKFPVGQFDIDEQVEVPPQTVIEGNSNPNDPIDKTKKPDPSTQTSFVATTGVSDPTQAYCGTNGNMKQGEAQQLRIGFLLNSNTEVRNIVFQGGDTVRPDDNGSLCGGGVFETPGCVSPGFCNGVGTPWVGKTGCFDATGKPSSLITGDGKGVADVRIENVRLNDLSLSQPYQSAKGSQLAVWVAPTQDGSPTSGVTVTNLVSMLTRADGINLHGNVQSSVVENSHIENTGDDIYAFWGGYGADPSNVVFRNNTGKNPGVTRDYMYGVCVAIYGAKTVTVTGTKCYDRSQKDWNPGQFPSGDPACQHGAYCNSCLAYVHDGWFGAVYPDGNTINLAGNEYFYMGDGATSIPIPPTDRPLIRQDKNSKARVIPPGVIPPATASELLFL